MLTKEILIKQIPLLKSSDTGYFALSLMDECKLNHLPVVDKGKYIFLLAERDIFAMTNMENPVENASIYAPCVSEEAPVLEALQVMGNDQLTLLPVVNQDGIYEGAVTIPVLIEKMLEHHKRYSADCTIAVLDVPIDEAPRFGIMNTREDGTIYEFEEKPKIPKSTKASMGIYIFNRLKLMSYLEADEANPSSSNDFGKNIIPAMLASGENMQAWQFDGYWKDVGTIESLWDANMDLLNPNIPIKLNDKSWKIYSRNPVQPPHYISEKAIIRHSYITEGGVISGFVDYSVIFHSVQIETGAEVEYSIIMPGARIKKGARVSYSIIGENAIIGEGCVIGGSPESHKQKGLADWGIAVVGPGVTVQKGTVIVPGEMI